MNMNDRFARDLDSAPLADLRAYAGTLLMVTASTLVGLVVVPTWGTSPVDLLYLPAVLAAAGFTGLGPGLLAAVASALAYNFFFTQPVHTLRIASADDVVTVALLFLVALVTSQLASRMRANARNAAASARRNATIAGFARQLLTASGEETIASTACDGLARLFDAHAVILLADRPGEIVAATPPRAAMGANDLAIAAGAIATGKCAGRGLSAVATSEWAFYPVRAQEAVVGCIALARDDGRKVVADADAALLDNLADQLALALERGRLETQVRESEELRERNRLRAALLAGIGSDVEPRLTAMSGGLDALRREGLGDRALLATLSGEVHHLQRYLASLLDLGPESDRAPLVAGEIAIDLVRRLVRRSGEEVHLTPKEYAVLAELAKYPGRVLSHTHLLRAAWGPAQENQVDYLRVAVRGLRRKLERDSGAPTLIVNEPGVGYRLAIDA